jgi:hypothetical protein
VCAPEAGRSALREIDWQAPWLARWAALAPDLAAALRQDQALPEVLNQHLRTPVRFVPQADLPEGQAYESFIGEHAAVPTREGLHDAFNALCWHQWPQSKRRLNRLQVDEITRLGIGEVRGPVRDALTLIDENAVLLQAPEALWAALLQRNWRALFVEDRALWAQARVGVVGHALLEKLHQPYKSITAHVWAVPVPLDLGDDWAIWDDWFAQGLSAERLARKPLTPLPVLGIPGWWQANEDPAFYADPQVFRAPRTPVGA